MKIDRDVLEIIEAGTSQGEIYYLPDVVLDRKMYLKVNKVLELLGGKWDRKAKGHTFETPVEDRIESVLLMGEVVDKKKELQFFETPEAVVDQLCEMADLTDTSHVLEPSAGQGAILRGLEKHTSNLYWSELDEENASKIDIGIQVGKDFLKVSPDCMPFDRIVMNPPFSRQRDIDHVFHALKFINHGILVSVMSPSIKYRTNKKTTEFKEFLGDYTHEIIELPEKSFKASGTMINTVILKVIK